MHTARLLYGICYTLCRSTWFVQINCFQAG